MKFCIIFLSLFFINFPPFTNGKKECAFDGKCYLPEDSPTPLNGSLIKECDGPCFAFKCLNYTTEITYGSGCYEDFVNACKWVDPRIKEEFLGKKDYKYWDETAIIVACEEGSSNCGITQLASYEKGKEIEQNHGKTGKNGKGGCKYDNRPLPYLEKRKCNAFKACDSYPAFFSIDKYENSSTGSVTGIKECTSPCAIYMCVSEGKYLVGGGGCYDDFEKICSNISSSKTLAKIKANMKNYFYYDENIFVITCTNRDDCHLYNYKAYFKNYIFALKRKFGSKIIDKKSEKKCEYIIAWAPTNQINITEGATECNVLEYNIHLSDSVSCFFFKLPYILYDIKFGYFAMFFSILVILISLFGRIKLQYRWFILNMAILDFLNGYGFICSGVFDDMFSSLLMPHDSCMLDFLESKYLAAWSVIVNSLPAVGLFILTGSRVLSLYFPHFYKRFAKTWKILLLIIFADLFYILIITTAAIIDNERDKIELTCFTDILNVDDILQVISNRKRKLKGGAVVFPAPKICAEEARALAKWTSILVYIKIGISQISLFASIIFVIMLITKIGRQLKFQAKSNKEMLKMNIRIITVFLIQTSMLLIVFGVDAIINYINTVDLNIYYRCPFWLQWIFNQNTLKSLREIRAFIDSFITLAIMSGYREDLIDSILWISRAPKRIFKAVKCIFTQKNSLTYLLNFCIYVNFVCE